MQDSGKAEALVSRLSKTNGKVAKAISSSTFVSLLCTLPNKL
jgi:hypothetical protein